MRNKFSEIVFMVGFLLALALIYSCSSGCGGDEYTGGSCDAADYGSVDIGGQIWMAKNWGCYAPGSKCYNNDPANCDKYGRLYDWSTAMGIDAKYNSQSWGGSDLKHKGICPTSWHLPSDVEWTTLINYVENDKGCGSCAGGHLKATSDWYSGGNGLDSYRFAALPGGGGYSVGYFGNAGYYGIWWSSTENDDYYHAYILGMFYLNEFVDRVYSNKSGSLFSVRCLQD